MSREQACQRWCGMWCGVVCQCDPVSGECVSVGVVCQVGASV